MGKGIGVYVLCLVFLGCAVDIYAQTKVFTIKPGEEIKSVVPDSVSYMYPSFKNGIVHFKDGRRVNARLNYNSLYEEVMFIGPRGDTMALDNGAAIKFVVVETDSFYFDNFFLKGVGTYGDIKLATRDLFVIVDVNAIGAMGSNAPSSVTTVKSLLRHGNESKELTRQEVMKIRKETQLFLGDKFNNYKIANRKNFAELFPGKSKKVKEYLKENSVSFNKKEDLDKLILFLQAG